MRHETMIIIIIRHKNIETILPVPNLSNASETGKKRKDNSEAMVIGMKNPFAK
jgi:hypothetical protein